MTMTLTLDPEKEARLRQKAQAHGLSLEEFALESLNQVADEQLPAEAYQQLFGTLESGKPGLAEASEEEWGKGLIKQYQAQGLTLKEDQ